MFREICQVSYQTITNLSLDSQNLSVNLVENQTNQFSLSDISSDSKKSSFLDMLNSRTEERFSQNTDNNFATSFEKSDSFEKSSNSEVKNNLNEIEDSSVKEMNDNGRENKIQKSEESKKIDESKVSETDKKKSLNVSDENKVAKDELLLRMNGSITVFYHALDRLKLYGEKMFGSSNDEKVEEISIGEKENVEAEETEMTDICRNLISVVERQKEIIDELLKMKQEIGALKCHAVGMTPANKEQK